MTSGLPPLGHRVRSRRTPWAAVRREVGRLDLRLFRAIANTRGPVLDAVMPVLTDVADRSVLWLGIAGAMSMTDRPRLTRGAARGLASIAVTSLITNQVAKRIHPRERPAFTEIPLMRHGRRRPTSSSFPSGHAASAAAFASAVAMESPAMGLLVRPLALAVGVSRVVTGAHYPSDVLVGFGLGSLIARLGGVLVPPLGPAPSVGHDPARIDTGRRPLGEGVTIVVNSRSGIAGAGLERAHRLNAQVGGHARMLRRIKRSLPAARIIECGPHDDLAGAVAQAGREAEIIGVVGGDGTIGLGAREAMATAKPLAVFPGGTFNHFARAIGASTAVQQIRAIQAGTATTVDVAYVNEGLFLNTASVVAYTQFVRIRERLQASMPKPLAMIVASLVTLRRGRSVRLSWNGMDKDISLAFFGNAQYLPPGFAPAARPRIDDGLIDVRLLEERRGLKLLWIIACVAVGRLRGSGAYWELSVPELTLHADRPVTIARDGELGERTTELRLHVDPQALTVLSPLMLSRFELGR